MRVVALGFAQVAGQHVPDSMQQPQEKIGSQRSVPRLHLWECERRPANRFENPAITPNEINPGAKSGETSAAKPSNTARISAGILRRAAAYQQGLHAA